MTLPTSLSEAPGFLRHPITDEQADLLARRFFETYMGSALWVWDSTSESWKDHLKVTMKTLFRQSDTGFICLAEQPTK